MATKSTASGINVLMIACAMAALPVQAEDWQFSFTPYVWATKLETTAGGQNASASSTINFNDLLPIVDAAWMSMFEARRGNWALLNDVVYMKISDDASGSHGKMGFVSTSASASFDQRVVDLFGGYTPDNSNTTWYAGLRYIYLDADASLKLAVATPRKVRGMAASRSRDEDWFDPVIGVRQVVPFDSKWSATLQLDVGGGVESEFSSIGTATVNYILSDDVTLRAGYRYSRIDKDDHDLLFDQTAQGVLMAASFRF